MAVRQPEAVAKAVIRNHLLQSAFEKFPECFEVPLSYVIPMKELCKNDESMISGRSIVVAARNQISSALAEGAVILNLKSGVYYDLDAVGARVWNLIQESRTVNGIQVTLLKEYEVEPSCCERDLLTFLYELAAEELIEVKGEKEGKLAKSEKQEQFEKNSAQRQLKKAYVMPNLTVSGTVEEFTRFVREIF